LNGAAPERFVLDTGALPLTLTTETANKVGLRAVSSMTGGSVNGHPVTTYLGVLPSLRIGQIELRNVPVSWLDGDILDPDGTGTAGTIGTGFFYHFLTTMDYKRRALILRRKTTAQQRAFRAEAARAGIRPQPLWLAGDHLPCTLGKINDYGPRVACIDSGATTGLNTSLANAQRAGITVNTASPVPVNGGTSSVYPITVDRMSIGNAINRNLPGSVGEMFWEGMTNFDLIGNFTHEFFKPFAVTFDYVGMNLYVG
jgi:predicted aspartyl protease